MGRGCTAEDRADCRLVCRARPLLIILIACTFLVMLNLMCIILALSNASVTMDPQYPATLLSSPEFTYNLTTASAEFSLWAYTERRDFTNTSVLTGQQDDVYDFYHFISTFETGCSYYGYPLVTDVGQGVNFGREPQGDNSLELTSPGCSPMIASRAFSIASIPVLMVTQLFTCFLLLGDATVVKDLLKGGSQPSLAETSQKASQFSRAVFVLVGMESALLVPLLICLSLWATASGFSGGEWNGYVYLFFAIIAYTLAMLWTAMWYHLHLMMTLTFTFRRSSQATELGTTVTPTVIPDVLTVPSSNSSTGLAGVDRTSSSSTLSV